MTEQEEKMEDGDTLTGQLSKEQVDEVESLITHRILDFDFNDD